MSPKTNRKNPAPKKANAPRKDAPKVKKTPAVETAPATPKASPFTRDARLPAVGTIVRREYHGKVHEVEIRADGFQHQGTLYRSLSALAKEVTGAKSINGIAWLLGRAPGTKAATTTSEKAPRGKKRADAPKVGGEGNDLATAAGQRAALREAGIVKGTAVQTSLAPAAKPKGTPEQLERLAKARAARSAKAAARKAAK